jgi:uncharacterized OB-fold protein
MANERDHVHPFEARVDYTYWAGLAEDELRIQRCERCQAWRWPADWRCPDCGSYDLGWEAIGARGTVFSWIRTRQPLVPAYADLVPYVNVLVELPQAGGARLLGLLVGDTSTVRVGASVVGRFQPPTSRTIDLPVVVWSLEDAQ